MAMEDVQDVIVWRWLGFSVLVLVGLTLLIAPAIAGNFNADIAITGGAFGVYAAMGGLIIGHRRGHATGWLLPLTGVAVVFANGFSTFPGVSPRYAAWVESWSWTLVFALFALLALTFPAGRGPSGPGFYARLGRAATWALPVLVAMAALTNTFGGPEVSKETTNPFGFLPAALGYVGLLGTASILLGAAVSLVLRRNRARGVEREQLTWVVFALVLLVTSLVITLAFTLGSMALGADDPGDSVWTPAFMVMILFPVSFAVAVLRFRLYEIDRIISRTVAYAVVVGVLAAVFAGIAVGVPQLLDLPTNNEVLTAAATLAAAALFNPVRKRVRDRVDRRFNRSRYNAEQEIERFANKLRTELNLGDLSSEMLDVVTTTMQPASASVWIREGR